MKFVAKQIEVDARQFTGTPTSAAEIAEWLGASEFEWDSKPVEGGPPSAAWIVDFGGASSAVDAVEGEWVVRRDDREFTVYPIERFIETFDEAPAT
jgi:hypothetical protein